jgi:indole-3-glycerol phosphate synthase/phosphoribosylanthranilate isomerase
MINTVPDILARIIEHKKAELKGARAELSALERRAGESVASRRDFIAALRAKSPAIIAEIKKASPSKGLLCADFDPAVIARSYAAGGAAALSVLTDQHFFQGSLDDLSAARAASGLPVLRKDFTLDPYHVVEAAAVGADAILLIAAVLTESEMRDLRELAERYGMASLVEVHSADELRPALASGARIIGVNNRDLQTFEVNLDTSLRLAELIPDSVLKVSESGIESRTQIASLQKAGYRGFLVGEHLMRSSDPAFALKSLTEVMIKICGITNREDAVAAVEAGATALGFNFWPHSPRYITPEKAAEIGRGLRVLKVGVFVDESPERVEETARTAGLDVVQLHGSETPDRLPKLRVWKAFRASIEWTPELFDAYPVEAFLLDSAEPGSGQTFCWSSAHAVRHRIIVAGGLDESNVADAIHKLAPWGIDACSRLEKSPGVKDHQKVSRFVRAARGELS